MAPSMCSDRCGTSWGSWFQAILYHISAAYLVSRGPHIFLMPHKTRMPNQATATCMLDGSASCWIRLNNPCVSAVRPHVSWLWPLVSYWRWNVGRRQRSITVASRESVINPMTTTVLFTNTALSSWSRVTNAYTAAPMSCHVTSLCPLFTLLFLINVYYRRDGSTARKIPHPHSIHKPPTAVYCGPGSVFGHSNVLFLFSHSEQGVRHKMWPRFKRSWLHDWNVAFDATRLLFSECCSRCIDSTAMWLRHHLLRGVDSVLLQVLLMGTCRQCGSRSVAGHNRRKVTGWDPVSAS